MKKLIATGVVLASVLGGASAQAAPISYMDGFQGGGCEIYGGNLSPAQYCIIANADGASTVCAAGFAFFENKEQQVTLIAAWNTSWGGNGQYGGSTCTNVEASH